MTCIFVHSEIKFAIILEKERLIEAEWEEKVKTDFIVEIKAISLRETGMINKITNAITLTKIAIRAFEVKEVPLGLEFTIALFVKDKSQVEKAMSAISSIKEVKKVYRTN